MKIIVQVGLSLLIVALIKAHVMAHMHDDVPSLGENFRYSIFPSSKRQ